MLLEVELMLIPGNPVYSKNYYTSKKLALLIIEPILRSFKVTFFHQQASRDKLGLTRPTHNDGFPN
ncbi:hypothetical protein PL9631_1100008 [Planktothrix paucivesiculata PCC 9631]|uniref:Uncharacterized protein n=1 Tax=Planktothrix paucivesiculata PCC 9631 TaxID=671071 RepID=A0A7Z9DW85_9CYAN|nr:hypothetical protein PL9631_1100008 [Planktothrix paucivesiculata PCC 9631]